MRVVGYGVTDTTLEYYGEADPKLLSLRDYYRGDPKGRKDKVYKYVLNNCGSRLANADFDKIAGDRPIWSVDVINDFINWQFKNQIRVRLYGAPQVIAALVMAPEGANEVKYEKDCR